MKLRLKFRVEDLHRTLIVGIFKRICCLDVFLMVLTSTEQLFIGRPFTDVSCIQPGIMIPISSNFCKKVYLQF